MGHGDRQRGLTRGRDAVPRLVMAVQGVWTPCPRDGMSGAPGQRSGSARRGWQELLSTRGSGRREQGRGAQQVPRRPRGGHCGRGDATRKSWTSPAREPVQTRPSTTVWFLALQGVPSSTPPPIWELDAAQMPPPPGSPLAVSQSEQHPSPHRLELSLGRSECTSLLQPRVRFCEAQPSAAQGAQPGAAAPSGLGTFPCSPEALPTAAQDAGRAVGGT